MCDKYGRCLEYKKHFRRRLRHRTSRNANWGDREVASQSLRCQAHCLHGKYCRSSNRTQKSRYGYWRSCPLRGENQAKSPLMKGESTYLSQNHLIHERWWHRQHLNLNLSLWAHAGFSVQADFVESGEAYGFRHLGLIGKRLSCAVTSSIYSNVWAGSECSNTICSVVENGIAIRR